MLILNIDINNIYDIISILCALIILCIMIFIIPKYNNNLKFEKTFFNNNSIKILIITLLLYCYLNIDTSLFLLISSLIFFIYWILNVNENFYIITEDNDMKDIKLKNEIDNLLLKHEINNKKYPFNLEKLNNHNLNNNKEFAKFHYNFDCK